MYDLASWRKCGRLHADVYPNARISHSHLVWSAANHLHLPPLARNPQYFIGIPCTTTLYRSDLSPRPRFCPDDGERAVDGDG